MFTQQLIYCTLYFYSRIFYLFLLVSPLGTTKLTNIEQVAMEITFFFSFNKKLHPAPMKTNQQVFTTKRRANGISWARLAPLGDCLLGVYSRIFLESFEQKSLKKSWKILRIFITLLCYGLHKKIAKNIWNSTIHFPYLVPCNCWVGNKCCFSFFGVLFDVFRFISL